MQEQDGLSLVLHAAPAAFPRRQPTRRLWSVRCQSVVCNVSANPFRSYYLLVLKEALRGALKV